MSEVEPLEGRITDIHDELVRLTRGLRLHGDIRRVVFGELGDFVAKHPEHPEYSRRKVQLWHLLVQSLYGSGQHEDPLEMVIPLTHLRYLRHRGQYTPGMGRNLFALFEPWMREIDPFDDDHLAPLLEMLRQANEALQAARISVAISSDDAGKVLTYEDLRQFLGDGVRATRLWKVLVIALVPDPSRDPEEYKQVTLTRGQVETVWQEDPEGVWGLAGITLTNFGRWIAFLRS